MVTPKPMNPTARRLVVAIDQLSLFIVKHWLVLFLIVYGIWVWLPVLAPILMEAGATGPASGLYFMYSLFCHQLPERSLFFFGPQPMYSLQSIGQVWSTENQLVLRQFVGNAQMGWKMAWSDRMISTYGGIWLAALIWGLLGKRAPRISLVVWIIFGVLPLGLDGFSHFINDIVAGSSGLGFRDTNEWLRIITGNVFPGEFYYGNMLGSFNSYARWITGLLFSFTTVFALFPILADSLRLTQHDLEYTLERARLRDLGEI